MRMEVKQILLAAVVGCGLFGTSAQACKLASPNKQPLIAAANGINPAPTALASDPDRLPPHAATIVGMWYSVFTDSLGDPPDPGFDSFYADGNELLIDQAAPATDNVCSGVWEQTGPLTYRLNHPSWYYSLDGTFLGLVVIDEKITLDRRGNKFTGTAEVTVYDPNMVWQFQYTGTLTGTRITANSKSL